MDELLELIDHVEQDEAQQPTRDALLENLYAALDDPRLADSWGEAFILDGMDSFMTVCGFVAARAAQFDFALYD